MTHLKKNPLSKASEHVTYCRSQHSKFYTRIYLLHHEIGNLFQNNVFTQETRGSDGYNIRASLNTQILTKFRLIISALFILFLFSIILKLTGNFQFIFFSVCLFLDKYIRENKMKERQHLRIFEPDERRPTGRHRLKWEDYIKIYFEDNMA